jgi:hypothetical protein
MPFMVAERCLRFFSTAVGVEALREYAVCMTILLDQNSVNTGTHSYNVAAENGKDNFSQEQVDCMCLQAPSYRL